MAWLVSPISRNAYTIPPIVTKELPPAPNVTVQESTPVDADTEKAQRRITLTDSPLPPTPDIQEQKDEKKTKKKDKNHLKAPLTIDLKKSKSDDNMNRSFSFKRTKSTSKAKAEDVPPMPGQLARGNSWTTGQNVKKFGNLSPPKSAGLQRSMSRREKFAKAIANPDMMFTRDPQSPPPESKFNVNPNSKFARTFFGNGRGIDFGSGVPQGPLTPPTPMLPDLEMPIFSETLISNKIATELPHGYSIRPLCRGDYYRGYMDVMRVLGRTGWVSEEAWEERCEWLRTMGSTYFILVVTTPNVDGSGEKVVASGTLMLERKFVHNMGTVGHIEDIAVGKDQKGKKMGLRVLEALVFAAVIKGCYKTTVNCTEGNEAFHAQAGFGKEGSQMVLHHLRKKEEENVYS